MAWVAGAIAATGVLSAAVGYKSSKDAASAAKGGADQASQTQLAMYGQSRQDLAPYRQVGGYALDAYARAMGLPTYDPNDQRYNQKDPMYESMTGGGPSGSGGAGVDPSKLVNTGRMSDGGRQIYADPESGYGYILAKSGGPIPTGSIIPGFEPKPNVDFGGMPGGSGAVPGSQYGGRTGATDPNDRYGGFYASPGYKFSLDQALEGVTRGAAARGYLPTGPGSLSGRFSKEMSRYASGLASQEFGGYMDRLARAAGLGGAASSESASGAIQTGSQIGQNQLDAGASRASGIMGQAGAIQNGLGYLTTAAAYYKPNPKVGAI